MPNPKSQILNPISNIQTFLIYDLRFKIYGLFRVWFLEFGIYRLEGGLQWVIK